MNYDITYIMVSETTNSTMDNWSMVIAFNQPTQ